MDDFKAYVFFPLLVGIVLLLIEYGVIKPLQAKERSISKNQPAQAPERISNDSLNLFASFWNNLLFSKTVLAKTFLMFLKLVFYVSGALFLVSNLNSALILTVAVATFKPDLIEEYLTVYSPLTISITTVIGLALLWAAARLPEANPQEFKFVFELHSTVVKIVIAIDILLALYFTYSHKEWIVVINSLSGIFFSLYILTAIRMDKQEQPTTQMDS